MKALLLLCLSIPFFQYAAAQAAGKSAPSGKSPSADTAHAMKDTQRLKDVVVPGRKPLFQQQAGGMVVNLESSILAKGSSALEVLERSPGVIIDHRNNSIALNGKAGVTVMLNGKLMQMSGEQLLTMLNDMRADNIEKIELLDTPPARYDAEGSAGIINIVLKKMNRPGTNANLSLTGGYGWGEKAAGSLSFDHNTGKTGVYGSYSFSHDKGYGLLAGRGDETVPVFGGPASFDFRGVDSYVGNSHNAVLGLDTRLTPSATAGVSINYSNSPATAFSDNHTRYTLPHDSLLSFDGQIGRRIRWTHLISSAYLEKKIGQGQQLNAGLDWLWYKNNDHSEVQSSFLDQHGTPVGTGTDSLFSPRQTGFANTTIQVGVARLDDTRRLSEKIRLETGIKGTYTVSSSHSGIESLINGGWVTSLGTSNYIDMNEGIGAAYGSVNIQPGAAVSLVIGARYEYSRTRMKDAGSGKEITDRPLGALFPNMSFSKKFGDKAEGQLSYSRRISRPTYNDLASFVIYNDPVSVFTGNPLLRPAITDNLKLGYTWRRYAFSILLSRDDYAIARYQLTGNPSGNLVFISPQNIRFQDNLTFQANLPWAVNRWWTMNYNLLGGWRRFRIDYTLQPVEKTYFNYSLNFSESFTLPRNFSAEISGWYNSKGYYGSTRVEDNGTVNIGFKKALNKDRGSLQLSVTDLFSTIHYSSDLGALTEEVYSTKGHVTYYPETAKFPVIKLTWSRSFGQSKTRSERKQGAQDERDRVRQE